jgi:chitinase
VLAALAAAVQVALLSGGLSAVLPTASARAASFAPYLDMTLQSDPALPAVRRETGARLLSLGFVIATAHRCEPSWGGIEPLRSGLIRREVAGVRASGADVVVSFGGAAGPDLSQVCATPQLLAAAYRSTVAFYRARQVDFDIEGAALDDPAGSRREILAIGLLERSMRSHRQPLRVSLTVPVDPTGLESDVLRLLRIARAGGVRLDIVNVMTMDYGDGIAPPGRDTMGGYAIAAATATERQLRRELPGGGFSRLGVTVLVGVNDVPDEVFTLADAQALVRFARAHRLGRLSMWSLGRDRACARPGENAGDVCSGVPQLPYAFSRLLRRY